MDNSAVLLDESSNLYNFSLQTENSHAKRQKLETDDDETDDFVVPLPDFDDVEEPISFQSQDRTNLTTRLKKSSKAKEKAAADERKAELKALKAAQKLELKELQEKKKAERLQKRLAKEAEQRRKKEHRQATRARQPKSMMKTVMIVIDKKILELGKATAAFETAVKENLLDSDDPVAVEFVSADVPYSIVWKLPDPFGTVDADVLSDEMVVALPVVKFLNLVHGSLIGDRSNLLGYFRDLKQKTPQKFILLVVGLDGYLLNYKAFKNRQHRQHCGDDAANAHSTKGLKTFDGLNSIVNPEDVDRILVELQMSLNVVHMRAADLAELAVLIQHFTKAVAEKPEKARKLARSATIGWQELGSSKAVKIGDDGTGRRELWRRVVTQCLSRQDPAFSAAVVEKYKNPRQLMEAYDRSDNVELARNLLSNLEESRRRYAASRRIHAAFTCPDPEALLDNEKL